MEIENTTQNPIPRKRKKGFLAFLLGFLSILILVGVLGGVAYYYLVLKKDNQPKEEVLQPKETKEITHLLDQIKIKNGQIKVLQEENKLLKGQVKDITQRLSYVIKPKNQMIVECYSAKIGNWTIPQSCKNTAQANLTNLLQNDQKIVALEVIGVVDEKLYRGRNSELKQEGLASFRAKTIIQQMQKVFPNIVFFEGLSQQKKNKRGFMIRAYYVQ